MSKSQDTWNKKEAEKKKAKKKQDKEQRKEERKANASSNFEDMLAYVDEYGNITSTPPDPTKKIEIKEEDIQIAIPKHIQSAPIDSLHRGIVTFFNESKGYGFIKDSDTQESIFVHVNGLVDTIKENNKVTFEIEMGPKGPNAIAVKLSK
ncbi:MAG: cold-shock protein [Cytophaga sp.]|uniref:cold-shock protein n=1 Tax=Cytophaga sp. TaxID=29535 RepID=UPI003F7EFDE6